MTDFENKLKEIGYRDVIKLNVNAHRSQREYYSALLENGTKIFIKKLNNAGQKELDELAFEKAVSLHVGQKLYPEPMECADSCIIINYIENIGDIKKIIKKCPEKEVLKYIESAFKNYIILLDNLNSGSFQCRKYGFIKQMNLYVKRWVYYSKKPTSIKEIFYHLFKFRFGINRILNNTDIENMEFVILGDLNPWNCMCHSDFDVSYIDYEKVCISDPNIDMANFYVKLKHHARNNIAILSGIDELLDIYKNTQYYNKDNFTYACSVFEYLESHWS